VYQSGFLCTSTTGAAVRQFAWSSVGAAEGTTHLEDLLVIAMSLLADAGLPARVRGRADEDERPGAAEVMARYLDLVRPWRNGRAARDAQSIKKQYADACKARTCLAEQAKEFPALLLEFAKNPGDQLGLYLEVWRWNEWTPEGGVEADDLPDDFTSQEEPRTSGSPAA
jgi:hypothetical protein